MRRATCEPHSRRPPDQRECSAALPPPARPAQLSPPARCNPAAAGLHQCPHRATLQPAGPAIPKGAATSITRGDRSATALANCPPAPGAPHDAARRSPPVRRQPGLSLPMVEPLQTPRPRRTAPWPRSGPSTCRLWPVPSYAAPDCQVRLSVGERASGVAGICAPARVPAPASSPARSLAAAAPFDAPHDPPAHPGSSRGHHLWRSAPHLSGGDAIMTLSGVDSGQAILSVRRPLPAVLTLGALQNAPQRSAKLCTGPGLESSTP